MTTKANAHFDSEMAGRMKADGIERSTGRCPICYRMVGLHMKMYSHILGCPGPRRKGSALTATMGATQFSYQSAA